MTPMTIQLADYGISPKTGFLPEIPVSSEPVYNHDWQHRAFIERIEADSQVRRRVLEHLGDAVLTNLYNDCVDELFRFRAKHLEYAASYIHKQALQANNSNAVGTGGTPFMDYLAKHRDETKIAVLS